MLRALLGSTLAIWGTLQTLAVALAPLILIFSLFTQWQVLESGLAWHGSLQMLETIEVNGIGLALVSMRTAFSS